MKRWIALFLAIFTLLLASCELGGEEQTTTKATETTTKEQTTTTVAEETTADPYADCVDLSDYKIIYSTEAKSYEYDCALALQTAIKTASGKTLPIMADDENEGKTRYEIVVGNTNRSALYQLDTTGINYAGYIVKTEGKRFVVFANDKTGLKAAVEHFASILSIAESKIYIAKEINTVCASASERLNYEDVKAMWLSQYDMHNIYCDPKTNKQRPKSTFTTLLCQMLDNVVSIGINTVVVQMRPNGDSMYPSEYYAPCDWVVGEYYNTFSYDPVEIIVAEAHKRNLSIHAWINPMRSMTEAELLTTDDKYQLKKWIQDSSVKNLYLPQIEGKVYLNPAYPVVRQLIVDAAREMLTKYPFDGLHMDDFFYPTTLTTFDSAAYNASGKTMSVANWRRDNVNKLVAELFAMAKDVCQDIIFGISPQGNMNNNYNYLYADMYTWCANEGYIDYICPQIYWGFTHEICPFAETTDKWNDIIKTDSVKLWVGMTLSNAISGSKGYHSYAEWNNNRDVLKRCLEYTQTVERCVGVCYFCYQYFWDPVSGEDVSGSRSERMNLIPVLKEAEW